MKSRTIKKTIFKKINEWIESITDEVVKNAVRQDLIVTGGSIASMLLGQEVNDFDIYFKTRKTVELVSEYYVNKINQIYAKVIDDKKKEAANRIQLDL